MESRVSAFGWLYRQREVVYSHDLLMQPQNALMQSCCGSNGGQEPWRTPLVLSEKRVSIKKAQKKHINGTFES